jgi:alanine-glyoxylate transaminase/serine-glyoxylate transaminase/serine-pyruvate transaminase
MEAAFVNTVGPGDVVVVGVNGLFGERMCDVAARCGAEVVRVDAPWGQPLDADAVLAAHPAPKVIAVVHAETSTGVRNDVAAVAAGKGEALLLADCVTSLGGIPVAIDGWGVDVAYSGTQKCLGVAPGLAPFTMNPRAWERRIPTPRSWYLDLGMIGDYTSGATRKYHHTAPIAMITSLHAALGALLEEGLEAAWARHAECGTALQDGLEKMGLQLWVPEGFRLPQLTTVVVPDGVDDAEVRRTLLGRYGIEIGGGVGPWAGRIWRIGCMGHTARRRHVTLLLAALSETLGR